VDEFKNRRSRTLVSSASVKFNDERQIVRQRIRNCILNILRQIPVDGSQSERLGNVFFRLEWLLSIVIRYHQTDLIERHVVDLLCQSLRCLSRFNEPGENEVETPVVFTGSRGRPMHEIPQEQLNFLIGRRFTVKQLADILGISERTVQRRLQR
jgi:AraC-like DNA-binding protein